LVLLGVEVAGQRVAGPAGAEDDYSLAVWGIELEGMVVAGRLVGW
jgi:hypothetical protein